MQDGRGIDLADVPHKAQIVLALQLFRLNQAAVQAAKPDRAPAHGLDEAHQVLVRLAGQDHLHHIGRRRVGIAQAVDKPRGNVQPLEHAGDFRAAAVHQDDLDAHQGKQDDIAHDRAA